ncbi:MAG TPA: arginase family protein [Symbiobacteriaceae bacterium]
MQSGLWREEHRPEHLMLTLGGDHTTSLGTMWALKEMGHQFDVIWIDAHGDFNIVETSPSGNPHGMVLSLACGLMPAYMPRLVEPADLRLWGIRDLDTGERDLLVREQVEVLGPDQVRHEWDQVLRRLKRDVFISFDIDAVEPAEAPGTMTPAPGGLHRFEALDLVTAVARQCRVLALDIVEYHPDRDRHGLTAGLSIAMAEAVLSGQAIRATRSGLGAAAGN